MSIYATAVYEQWHQYPTNQTAYRGIGGKNRQWVGDSKQPGPGQSTAWLLGPSNGTPFVVSNLDPNFAKSMTYNDTTMYGVSEAMPITVSSAEFISQQLQTYSYAKKGNNTLDGLSHAPAVIRGQ